MPVFDDMTNSNFTKMVWSQMFFAYSFLNRVDGNHTPLVDLLVDVLGLYPDLFDESVDALELFTTFFNLRSEVTMTT